MTKIERMLRLQQELNDTTNGTGWERGVTRNGKPIDWRRCIWLEAAELVESYPWKHWKDIDATPDYDNIRIEVVDIWHFVLSEALRIFAVEGRGSITDLARAMTGTEAYRAFEQGERPERKDHYEEIACVETLTGMLFRETPVEEWTAQFYRVALQSGLDLDALYRLYIGKNILNRFRTTATKQGPTKRYGAGKRTMSSCSRYWNSTMISRRKRYTTRWKKPIRIPNIQGLSGSG